MSQSGSIATQPLGGGPTDQDLPWPKQVPIIMLRHAWAIWPVPTESCCRARLVPTLCCYSCLLLQEDRLAGHVFCTQFDCFFVTLYQARLSIFRLYTPGLHQPCYHHCLPLASMRKSHSKEREALPESLPRRHVPVHDRSRQRHLMPSDESAKRAPLAGMFPRTPMITLHQDAGGRDLD